MKGPIAWFVKNPVAANLLMLIILFGGIAATLDIDNQMFPSISPQSVQVTMVYPGAGPLEVEEQICIRVEEALTDIDGIEEVKSTARQGFGQVEIKAIEGWDLQRLLNDVKARVDAINTFPGDAERPIVSEMVRHVQVMNLAVAGNLDEAGIKKLAEQVREGAYRISGVSQVDIRGTRPAEVSVEIPEETLRAYNLRFEDIVQAIRGQSINLPAGQVRNNSGDIQIQTYGQAYKAQDFEAIVILKNPDGSQVLLGDIAQIHDGFQESNFLLRFNGKPAAELQVYVGENPDFIGVSDAVHQYIDNLRTRLPENVEVKVWFDFSIYLKDRLSLLLKNASQGLVLVFILLMLFLRPALAMWVTVGIAIAYFGAIWMMPFANIPISVISTFAFLLILGIVVDDAIVVGESVHTHYEQGLPGPVAAAEGAISVSKPVTFAVLTTIVVFLPMLFLPGSESEMFLPVAVVAISALSFSLIESFFILPSHLRHLKPEKPPRNALTRTVHRLRLGFSGGLDNFSQRIFLPLLRRSLHNRGTVLALFTVLLLVSVSVVIGGWLRVGFLPDMEGEMIIAQAQLEEGIGFEHTVKVKDQLEGALNRVSQSEDLVTHDGRPYIQNRVAWVWENNVFMIAGLVSNEDRDMGSSVISRRWREEIGTIEKAENFTMSNNPAGGFNRKDITFRLRGSDTAELEAATDALARRLATYPGVFNMSDSLTTARKEIRLKLKPYAETLGISLSDLARQVRYGFYGAEAQRIPRLREDVRVLVRYPKEQRQYVDTLENMRIRTADGREVPFSAVAEAEFVPGFTSITRIDRQRVVLLETDVVASVSAPDEIVRAIVGKEWPELRDQFPGVTLNLYGEQKDRQEFMSALLLGFAFSLLVIYALMAVEFHSYWQPFVILSAVPFGIAGALLGHLVTGIVLSVPSFLGLLATAGVVVNDNLVLLDRINRLRKEGMELFAAVEQGAKDRLRPIILTSLTTFFGLTPILLETSVSAAFLKPMVVSLAFGVLLATTVTLVMVPAFYTWGELLKKRWHLHARAEEDIPESST